MLETAPPEVISDVMARGIVLVGGGATISGFSELLEESVRIPIHIAHDPMTAVVRGAGIIIENLDEYRDILIDGDEGLPSIE